MKHSIRIIKQNLLWIFFIGFAFYAIWKREDEFIFLSQGPYSIGKYIIWVIFFGFLSYSVYCSTKENFFKSVIGISKMYWGWQIGIDLYIGLILFSTIIFFHGGILVLLVWLLPILIYANLATLLYLALNYDALINHFMVQ